MQNMTLCIRIWREARNFDWHRLRSTPVPWSSLVHIWHLVTCKHQYCHSVVTEKY